MVANVTKYIDLVAYDNLPIVAYKTHKSISA